MMVKHLIGIILIFLGSIFAVQAQLAVISSQDGYANVRAEGNNKAKVIDKLDKFTVILFDEEFMHEKKNADWIPVQYIDQKNRNNLGNGNIDLKAGYLHKSQFKIMDALPSANPQEFKFLVETQTFNISNKKIEYYPQSQSPVKINGQFYFGGDCGLPKTEVKSMRAMFNKKNIQVPMNYIWGILHANKNYEAKKFDGHYFVKQEIGDGGCFSFLVWEFSDTGLQQRFVGWNY
ncbi:hypothetical protein VJ786_06060 [Sphingobacterium sp. PU5-4]|uniref:SH3 domain-containing protein n=2 Tax=Sphingobacterium TaxID=28453 RepID=A0ABU8I4D0_9SPHI